jgi:hypothetical protein
LLAELRPDNGEKLIFYAFHPVDFRDKPPRNAKARSLSPLRLMSDEHVDG